MTQLKKVHFRKNCSTTCEYTRMASYFHLLLLLTLSTSLPAESVSSRLGAYCLNQRAIPVSQALEKGFLRHRNLPSDFFDHSGNTYTSELEEDTRGSPKTLVAYSNNMRIVEDASASLEAYVASRIEECLATMTDEWETGLRQSKHAMQLDSEVSMREEPSETAMEASLSQSKRVMQLESEVAFSNEPVEGAVEASLSQSKRVMQLESEVAMRDEALSKLRREFESIKAKATLSVSHKGPKINKYMPPSWNLIVAGMLGGATALLFIPLCLAGLCCWIRKHWKGHSTPLQGEDVELGEHQSHPDLNPLPAIQCDFPVGRLPEAVANN